MIMCTCSCLFVCTQVCKERAEKLLRSPVDLSLLPITFEKALTFSADTKSSGWTIDADKTPTVSYV